MCERCKDPTELQTNVAGVTCELCEEGVMLPRWCFTIIIHQSIDQVVLLLVLKSIKMFRDPLDQYSDWLCNKCDFSLEVSMLAKMLGQSGQS